MAEKRIVTYKIEHCNNGCPHFYHNYYDRENIWCELLNEKIYDYDGDFLMWHDSKKREFPQNCKLPRSEE